MRHDARPTTSDRLIDASDTWEDEDPKGQAMRCMPSRNVPWGITQWVSEHGVVRRRYYNASTRYWVWSDECAPVENDHGDIGHYANGIFHTVPQMIAVAWVKRSFPMRRLDGVRLVRPDLGMVASNMAWEHDEDKDVQVYFSQRSRRWSGIAFRIGFVRCQTKSVRISDDGYVSVRGGKKHRGLAYVGGYYVAVPQVGIISIEYLRAAIFDRVVNTHIPPRIAKVLHEVTTNKTQPTTVKRLARVLNVKESTAWNYACASLCHMSTTRASRFVLGMLDDERTYNAFEDMIREHPEFYTRPLREVVLFFGKTCEHSDKWCTNPHRYPEARALRHIFQRTA